MRRLIVLSALAMVPASSSTLAEDAPQPPRPNLLWIWADNLGYGDLGVYGSRKINTPVIDRLAAGGVRLTQYYVAHTVCSPSRGPDITCWLPPFLGTETFNLTFVSWEPPFPTWACHE